MSGRCDFVTRLGLRFPAGRRSPCFEPPVDRHGHLIPVGHGLDHRRRAADRIPSGEDARPGSIERILDDEGARPGHLDRRVGAVAAGRQP